MAKRAYNDGNTTTAGLLKCLRALWMGSVFFVGKNNTCVNMNIYASIKKMFFNELNYLLPVSNRHSDDMQQGKW